MSIDECRIKEFFLFYLLKIVERSDIYNSSFDIHHSSFPEVSYERRLWPRASSQIEKETNEHRTSNNVFCLFYTRLSEATSTIRHSTIVIRHSLKFHIRVQDEAVLNTAVMLSSSSSYSFTSSIRLATGFTNS
jgi:hypothetical protein